jgi:hypothetical protein
MKLTEMHKNVVAVIFFMTLAVGGTTFFARQSAFAAHERSHKEKELLEVLYDCETKYADTKKGFIFERCKDAKVEYEQLKEKGEK